VLLVFLVFEPLVSLVQRLFWLELEQQLVLLLGQR
jgi:hypothetical protein